MKKSIIVSHSYCTDGLTATAIMKLYLYQTTGENPTIVFAAYGKEESAIEKIISNSSGKTTVYIVDFSFNEEITSKICKANQKVIVLDHHIGVIDKLQNVKDENFELIFDNDKSGARLAYDYALSNGFCFKEISNISRITNLVQDRDLWQFKFKDTVPFAEYIFSNVKPNDVDKMISILSNSQSKTDQLIKKGKSIADYKQNLVENKLEYSEPEVKTFVIKNEYGSLVEFDVLLVNETQADLVSQLGNALVEKYNIPVLLYNISRPSSGFAECSLRSIDSLPAVDVFCRHFGGGGHRNSSGCKIPIKKLLSLGDNK